MLIDVPILGGRLRSDRCLVMGILNATPDSFSDGGELADPARLDARIDAMLSAGADILDVGGESTRPGHTPVPAEMESARVLPVIQAIRAKSDVPISIDTSKAVVAAAALDAGASLVNDVRGAADLEMAPLVARHGCAIVLMRDQDCHGDIVAACKGQLAHALARAKAGGVPHDAIILDPGLGFGARPGPHAGDNLALVDGLHHYSHGRPVLIGASRKRFTGVMAGSQELAARIEASADVALRAARAGAAMVRVHDVAPTVAALQCV